jgi:cytochrome c553
MKSTLQSYQREKDYARLTTSLEKLAANAPEGYGTWKALALAGAAAAQKHDDSAISKNCKTCHNEHRARFRKERRTEPVF